MIIIWLIFCLTLSMWEIANFFWKKLRNCYHSFVLPTFLARAEVLERTQLEMSHGLLSLSNCGIFTVIILPPPHSPTPSPLGENRYIAPPAAVADGLYRYVISTLPIRLCFGKGGLRNGVIAWIRTLSSSEINDPCPVVARIIINRIPGCS